MDKWKDEFNKLIKEQTNEEYFKRAEEISSLLEKLSNYAYYPDKTHLNIQSGYDFARDELRGACQRYIYGQFQDSILYSCFSVEMSLIAKLDEILDENEKNIMMKEKTPPTLSTLISKSLNYKILNKKTKKLSYNILEMRNIHIHSVNFISPLIISYQKIAKKSNLSSLDKKTIEKKLKKLYVKFPELESVVKNKYNVEDMIKVYKAVDMLPTFRWAANQGYLKSIEKEVDNVMSNMVEAMVSRNLEALNDYFKNYILRKRALEALKVTEQILSEIKLI